VDGKVLTARASATNGVDWETATATPTGTAGGDLSGTYPNPLVSLMHPNFRGVSGATTIASTDGTVWLFGAAPVTWILPTAASVSNQLFALVNGTASGGVVTVSRSGSDLITERPLLLWRKAKGYSYNQMAARTSSLSPVIVQ